jgi:SAM-dependent methyltransferase
MAADHQAEPCPWWLGYVLASPLRKLLQNPSDLVAPYVEDGMVVLEPGCGMGFFTLELAGRVGVTGRVVAVDLQKRMLDGLRRRAGRAGLLERIDIRQVAEDRLGISDLDGQVDLVLAFYVVHELANPGGFFEEVHQALRPTGKVLIVEPRSHGGGDEGFDEGLRLAARSGLVVLDRPTFKRNQVAILGPVAPG